MTSFVGREKEMEEIKNLLTGPRLLTLTGSGGSGKSRLSLQVAAEVLDQYPDGVWLAELAPLTDPDLVVNTVAQVLGISEQAGQSLQQTLIESLKNIRLLLLLDNCEHLLSASARLSDALLRSCPHVKILASSREGLGIGGEQTYRVPSLSLPDLQQKATIATVSQYEAVRLFVERAVLTRPDFAVTNENAPVLASVCHRLDGIPLAIELAAARVRALSVEQINSKLDNRFRLLTGGSRAALPRQQTLRALIDWSYDLLKDQEKALLLILSTFAGGWTLEAAEQVGAGTSANEESIEDWKVLDLLTSLSDKSLVIAETLGESTRYRLLETVRQYARERLAESGAGTVIRARHRDYFLKLAEEIAPKLQGSEQAHWLEVLEQEHDNLRQALTFCQEDSEQIEAGLRLGAALWRFWLIHVHYSEGREQLSVLLSHPEGTPSTLARAHALTGTGILANQQGEYTEARSRYEESLAIHRELENEEGVANTLSHLGIVARRQADYQRARSLYAESLTILRELGNKDGIANLLSNLGDVTTDQTDYTAALTLYEECLAIYEEIENKGGIAKTFLNLGGLALAQTDYTTARSLYEKGLAVHQEIGNREGIAASLTGFASLAVEQQQEARSARLWGATMALREAIGAPFLPDVRAQRDHDFAVLEKALGQPAFTATLEEGRTMPQKQAIALALEQEEG